MPDTQLALYEQTEQEAIDTTEWGTFKDSLRAPIHRWFTYPAGFSFRAVEASLHTNGVAKGSVVYDPFMGSGTTNVAAKKLGYSSYGVEAHPFVYRVAKTKLNWNLEATLLREAQVELEAAVRKAQRESSSQVTEIIEAEFPELVLKCFEEKTLYQLMLIRNAIRDVSDAQIADFFFVALTSILRQVSTVSTGWPYIAPKKPKLTSLNKDALGEFRRQVYSMLHDIEVMRHDADPSYDQTIHHIFQHDARNTYGLIPDLSADHVFTSPPYLNNFDYADRTRLELYFFGEARTWGDISQQVRTRLITSATTQIARDDPRYVLSKELKGISPDVYDFLQGAVSQLATKRLTKGGKKSYDHLVTGYFNDMLLVLTDVYRVLKHGAKAVFVLGDSAPYGVYVPTDEIIGRIGLSVGFSDYALAALRTRGGKWKDNPQRHGVQLRESIVTLSKG